MYTLITKMITLDILQKCKLHYLMFFLLFQSNDKTGQECAEWCEGTAECNGFAVVDPSVRPGIHRCYLKHALTYPPTLPHERATLIYYKLTGLFNIRDYKMRVFLACINYCANISQITYYISRQITPNSYN